MVSKLISIAVLLAGASLAVGKTAPLQPRQSTLPAVEVRGNAFFAGGKRFYVRGLDYQPGGSSNIVDPIAEPDVCKRDVAKFKKLGLNTIRVYAVDNKANHDACMEELANAGIYLALDVNTPDYSINRAKPGPSYNEKYLQSLFATVDAFAKYTNTLLFFSGNEVINDGPTSASAPYVKATTRDLRRYIKERGYRQIPVGYSAADVDTNRFEMAQYMNCGNDEERSDFFAFNDYSWCDPSSFVESGWSQKVKNFTDYGLPLFLSEYGCIKGDRQFKEVESLFSTDMSSVYSGGLVYEYSQEGNNYGLVNISSGGDVTEDTDFGYLQDALAGVKDPSGDGGYNANKIVSDCPAKNAPNWDVDMAPLPTFPKGAESYLKDGAGPGPGLTGDGSQNAGPASSGTGTGTSGTASATASPSGAAVGLHRVEDHSAFVGVFVMLVASLFGAALV